MGLYNLSEEQSSLMQNRANSVMNQAKNAYGSLSSQSTGGIGNYKTSFRGRTQGLLGTPSINTSSSTTNSAPKVSLPNTSSSTKTQSTSPSIKSTPTSNKSQSSAQTTQKPGIRERVSNILGYTLPPSSSNNSSARPGIKERVQNIMNSPTPSQNTSNTNSQYKFTAPSASDMVNKLRPAQQPRLSLNTPTSNQTQPSTPVKSGPSEEEKNWIRKYQGVANEWRSGAGGPGMSKAKYFKMKGMPLAKDASNGYDKDGNYKELVDYQGNPSTDFGEGKGLGKRRATNASFDRYNNNLLSLKEQINTKGHDKMGLFRLNEGFMDKAKSAASAVRRGIRKATGRGGSGEVTVTKRKINYNDIPPAVRAKLQAQGVTESLGDSYYNESDDNWRGTTPGISLSPVAKRKLSNMGRNNHNDMNFGDPNGYYCNDYDRHFLADGDDPETSKTNIPAILAAKTAGGSPWPHTVNNNISNKIGSDVFKLGKLRDDEYTPY